MTCQAARCTVPADAALQWLVARFPTPQYRREPICAGHRQALTPFLTGHSARIISLAEYALTLAREAATVTVTWDTLVNSAEDDYRWPG